MKPGNPEKTVLVIEDEVDVRRFAARVLELEGYRVLEAGDGEVGLSLALREKVDLILLDLRLPRRDGWSVLAVLKAEAALREVPVVVFTASAEAQQRGKALEMGAIGCLVKPLSAATLRKAIRRALRDGKVSHAER